MVVNHSHNNNNTSGYMGHRNNHGHRGGGFRPHHHRGGPGLGPMRFNPNMSQMHSSTASVFSHNVLLQHGPPQPTLINSAAPGTPVTLLPNPNANANGGTPITIGLSNATPNQSQSQSQSQSQ